jgi:hypothetical protein
MGSRVGFPFVAALAGWAVAWCLACVYFALVPAILHQPWHPAPAGIVLIYLLCTLVFVFGITLVFGAPYVAIRSTTGMLHRPWRFYVETGLVGLASIAGYLVLDRPQAESLKDTLLFGLPLYGGFSLATSTMTSFVYLHWLRSRQRRQIGH